MSFEATRWAYGVKCELPGLKAVLVALGHFADHQGYCFPSQTQLSAMTGHGERSVRRYLKTLEGLELIRRERRRVSGGTWARTGYQLFIAENHRPPVPIPTESPPAKQVINHRPTRPPATVAADRSIESADLNYRSEIHTPLPPSTATSGCVGGISSGLSQELERKPLSRASSQAGSRFSLKECNEYAKYLKRTGQGIANPGAYAYSIRRSGLVDELLDDFFSPLFQQAAVRKPKADCLKCFGTGSEIVPDKGARSCECVKAA